MLKLTGGRSTHSHPKGEIPQRLRGAEVHIIVVGDLDAAIKGEQGVTVKFHDETLTAPLEPTRNVYIDELEPKAEAVAEARAVAEGPVKLIERKGGEFHTSRGRFDVSKVRYADGGKSPNPSGELVDEVFDRIAKLFPMPPI
jgi:hypothetical protein